jgi:glutamine synthetase
LSETAKRVIGGLLKLAPSLTAFGNTIPASYLRLVPHQEAPTCICWGGMNRSVLVRVPLGWRHLGNLSADVNPTVKRGAPTGKRYQTVEIRSPDGSANAHLLIAGIGVAARWGLTSPDALKLADQTRVSVNIFKEEHKAVRAGLEELPASCAASADALLEQAKFYEDGGVFSRRLVEGVAGELKAFDDREMIVELRKDKAKAEAYAKGFTHCG